MAEREGKAMAVLSVGVEVEEEVEDGGEGGLYVFEADYQTRTFTGSGAEPEIFGQLYGGDGYWEDPFRSVFAEDLAGVKAAWASYLAGEGPYRIEHRANGPRLDFAAPTPMCH